MNEEGKYIEFIIPNKVLRSHPTGNADLARMTVGSFMRAHGFDESKYSDADGPYYVYISGKEMKLKDAYAEIEPLISDNLWLQRCLKDIRVVELLGKPESLTEHFRRGGD